MKTQEATDRLADILARQKVTSYEVFGTDLATMSVRQRVMYIRNQVLAATDELHEALNETTWKTWEDQPTQIHRENMLSELVDVLHFLVNLMLVISPGRDAEQLANEVHQVFITKQQILRDRKSA